MFANVTTMNLALTKLIQTGEHQTGMAEVPSSVITGSHLLFN